MESELESKALLVAGVVWGVFILVGLIRWPVKLSALVAVGGGFIVAVVEALLARVYFEDGWIAVVAVLLPLFLLWRFFRLLDGR